MTVGSWASNEIIDARTGGRSTWAQLPDVEFRGPAVLTIDSSVEALAGVYSHVRTGEELLVAAQGRLDTALREELLADGFRLIRADGTVWAQPTLPRAGQPGRLWLLTSGSTGRPKRVGHTLASLSTVSGTLPPRRWLCPYSPGTYAWWQVVTLGLGHVGQDLVVVDPADADGWVQAGREFRVTAASGTPTFWRQALLAYGEELAGVPLEQISLGGEPVDQAVLDQLREVFPTARISWIYASSEAGASIVVHDGRAGFPAEWLEREKPGRPTLAIQDGELVINSPYHGAGLAGAFRTGDAVVIDHDRVLITGRLDRDEINVGGAKVSAGVVRNVLLAHPDVMWAHVRGRRAPLVGNVVVADVVLADGVAEDQVELVRWCAARLPEYAVPRRIRRLVSIPVKETLKSDV